MNNQVRKILLALVILLAPASTFAAELSGGERYNLSSGQTVSQNLYAAGNEVVVAGTVEGDAFLAGGTVTMSGTVQKDLFVAGGTITMNGTVNEDLRIAGGTIFITGTANGDVMIFGGQITITKDAKLAKDLYINGGQVTIDGSLSGPVTLNAGSIFVNGSIDGSLNSHSDQLQVGSTAKISGDVNHTGFTEPTIAPGASIGGKTNFTKAERPHTDKSIPFIQAWWLTKVAMMLVAALILFMVFKQKNTSFVQTAMTSFGREVLRGFIILIVLPIAIILTMITLIGLPLAFLALFLYAASICIACIYANVLAGNLTYKFLMKKADFAVSWQTIVVGVVMLQIIRLIPIIGWLAAFILFLAAFGTLWNVVYRTVRS